MLLSKLFALSKVFSRLCRCEVGEGFIVKTFGGSRCGNGGGSHCVKFGEVLSEVLLLCKSECCLTRSVSVCLEVFPACSGCPYLLYLSPRILVFYVVLLRCATSAEFLERN